MNQRTLASAVSFSGVGLHTGEFNRLTLHPAPENHGYVFRRTDLPGEPLIEADVDRVVGTQRGTTLEQNGARIHTTEHVLAALYGCEIDNALIDVHGPEIPILDGSSWPYVEALHAAGFTDQSAPRRYYTLRENLTYEDPEKGVEMLAVPNPDDTFRATVMVDYQSRCSARNMPPSDGSPISPKTSPGAGPSCSSKKSQPWHVKA